MKQWITALLLLAVTAGGFLGGNVYRDRNQAVQLEYQDMVDAAQADFDAAAAENRGYTPGSTAYEEEQLARQQELMAQAREEIERLRGDNSALDASIAQLRQVMEQYLAQEEYAYYKAAYDSMAEGKALVESYLENH